MIGAVSAPVAMAEGTGCPCSFWTEADTPGYTATDDLNAVELGLMFRSSEAVPVYGLRFYKSAVNTGEHVGSLWTASGELLARVTFTNETASGWQTAMFDTPVPTIAGVEYVVSYHAPTGGYSYDPQYFTAGGLTRGILDAPGGGIPNGLFQYSPVPTFPSGSFNGNNYWVDPIVGRVSVTNVSVTPASAEIELGATAVLAATATNSDGTTGDVTGSAAWTSSNPAIAAVNATGVVTAVAVGTATITATADGVSGSSEITVKRTPVLTSLTISGVPGSLVKGLSANAKVMASYDTGTTVDVTSQATFSSSASGIAGVTASGVVTGVNPGSATISAIFGGRSASVNVTVVPVRVQSLSVNPSSVRLRLLGSAQLSATVTYNDGTTKVVTSKSTWSSSNFLVANVSNPFFGTGGGRVTALLFGSATIRASYTENGVTVSGTSSVTVTLF